ncbi:hypothetical protein [Pseudanabaena sp. 'Roaring Creek']|uniref:hypothetical protein n=1 Tax=Pseudanabaena sp. 'Roaring Creek' TaxID=1681830 RepID=UPI0006D77A79|nr:hypothetical protein [Pseudanabaena sp. 'Roaring Creek']
MNPLILDLIEQLKSNNEDSIANAIVLFADVFLINNTNIALETQKQLLSEPYLSLRFTESQQKDIVNAISEVLILNPTPNLMPIIWVLSKVTARIGLSAFLDILARLSNFSYLIVDRQDYFQIENTFSRYFYLLEDPEEGRFIRSTMESKSPVLFYRKLLESQNPEIANSAEESLKFFREEFGLIN